MNNKQLKWIKIKGFSIPFSFLLHCQTTFPTILNVTLKPFVKALFVCPTLAR